VNEQEDKRDYDPDDWEGEGDAGEYGLHDSISTIKVQGQNTKS
jgi:hypothetical protein